jgi:hypothetical protein
MDESMYGESMMKYRKVCYQFPTTATFWDWHQLLGTSEPNPNYKMQARTEKTTTKSAEYSFAKKIGFGFLAGLVISAGAAALAVGAVVTGPILLAIGAGAAVYSRMSCLPGLPL